MTTKWPPLLILRITKASNIPMGCGAPDKVVEFIPDDQVAANIEKGGE